MTELEILEVLEMLEELEPEENITSEEVIFALFVNQLIFLIEDNFEALELMKITPRGVVLEFGNRIHSFSEKDRKIFRDC